MNVHPLPRSARGRTRRGSALLTTFIVLTMLSIAASSYVAASTQTYQTSYRQSLEVKTAPLCEAASQVVLANLWSAYKSDQNYVSMDAACNGAGTTTPMAAVSGTIDGVGNYSGGVISYTDPGGGTYDRVAVIRCVGWIDQNGDGTLNANEPCKTIDITVTFSLERSQVFDYTYFINNYGWMDGFGPTDLVVNGDMRSNGNFTFTNGSPTVNGSVYAAANSQLIPPAAGLVNTPPVKMSNSTYATMQAGNSRARQAYNAGTMGSYGSTDWQSWSNYIFDTNGQIIDNSVSGAVIGDVNGVDSWTRTSVGQTATTSVLDSSPTEQVVMPDLNDISYYENVSQTYTDEKQYFMDGTVNPLFGQGAYVESWNQSLNSGAGAYQTISTDGVVNGSASLIGSAAHPILIHGPVTFTQDAVIKGNVSGQGTIYSGRNVHIVGSIIYNDPPNFSGSDQTTVDDSDEHADMLALCATGSVIMGDTSQFTQSYPLYYMEPPFTKARYDDEGNLIPAYNAMNKDGTGNYLYQSVLGDSYIHSIASPVNQIDAVLYTNFVGGGDIGTGGVGLQFNGTIISKDEAMVIWSLPMVMNYDGRVRENNLTKQPLIDLNLPRSPTVQFSVWQDRGFSFVQ